MKYFPRHLQQINSYETILIVDQIELFSTMNVEEKQQYI